MTGKPWTRSSAIFWIGPATAFWIWRTSAADLTRSLASLLLTIQPPHPDHATQTPCRHVSSPGVWAKGGTQTFVWPCRSRSKKFGCPHFCKTSRAKSLGTQTFLIDILERPTKYRPEKVWVPKSLGAQLFGGLPPD